MSRALSHLPRDVYCCILDNPMTARQIADELNPLYMGNLNGQRVLQYLLRLRSEGLARIDCEAVPRQWVAVKPLIPAEVMP